MATQPRPTQSTESPATPVGDAESSATPELLAATFRQIIGRYRDKVAAPIVAPGGLRIDRSTLVKECDAVTR